MKEQIKTKKKGEEDLEFELFGGSELDEAEYVSKKRINKEAREKTLNWAKKQKIKLGKATLFAFDKL